MPSEELIATSKMIREAQMFTGDSVDVMQMREMMKAGILPLPEGATRNDIERNGIPLCHIGVPDARNDRGVLYLHGGGYVLGSLDTHAELMARVAAACRAPVLGVDYRLAPEHPYPAAVDDALASYEHLLAAGIKPEAIVVAGDSAGGGLALALMLKLKELGKPQPAGAVLFSPWSDLTASGESTKTRIDADPMISAEMLNPMAELYLDGSDAANPMVSPLFGHLAGLPPLLIQVGDDEILLDDSTRLAKNAEAAGVKADIEIFDGAFHVFQNQPHLPESADALKSVGKFFDAVTGA